MIGQKLSMKLTDTAFELGATIYVNQGDVLERERTVQNAVALFETQLRHMIEIATEKNLKGSVESIVEAVAWWRDNRPSASVKPEQDILQRLASTAKDLTKDTHALAALIHVMAKPDTKSGWITRAITTFETQLRQDILQLETKDEMDKLFSSERQNGGVAEPKVGEQDLKVKKDPSSNEKLE